MAPELIDGLEALRSVLGDPIKVVSGYRCPSYNKKIDGAKQSQHMLGRAADIQCDGSYPYAVAEAAEGVHPFDIGGIGRYDTFTHVDVRGCYGGKKARWSKYK